MWKEVSIVSATAGVTHSYDSKEAGIEHSRYGKVVKRIQKKNNMVWRVTWNVDWIGNTE